MNLRDVILEFNQHQDKHIIPSCEMSNFPIHGPLELHERMTEFGLIHKQSAAKLKQVPSLIDLFR